MGIITYILMSGQPPFYGDSPEQMKSAIVDKEIEFPKDSFSKISSKAKDFIRKCLVKNFNERPNVKDLL